MAPGGGIIAPQIWVPAIADMKDFNRKGRNEDRTSKVKSALLRDEALAEEKRQVFGDLCTGPAQNWFGQIRRSTCRS